MIINNKLLATDNGPLTTDYFMQDTIRIIGLQFNTLHGVRPEEKTLTQPFEVDVEISMDLSRPAVSDKLEYTIDYSQVVSIVKEVMNGEQCRLLERLAGRTLEKLCALVREGEITVRVRKPRAPIDVPFETIEVELKREIKKV